MSTLALVITLHWWMLPLALTVIAIVWAMAQDNSGDVFGIGALMLFVIVLFVAAVSWGLYLIVVAIAQGGLP